MSVLTEQELKEFIEGVSKQRNRGFRTVQIDIDVALQMASMSLEKLRAQRTF